MNNAHIIGRLTRDPELRMTSTGKPRCAFTVAVNRRQRQVEGGENAADFITCVAWNKDAENLCRYMRKGSQVAIDGEIRTGSYERDGQRIYTTDVWCNQIEFLGARNAQEDTVQVQRDMIEQAQDDDLPF